MSEMIPLGEGIVPFTGYKCVRCPDWIGEDAEDVVNHLATEYHQKPHTPDAFWDDISGQWVEP
jgi:hypothetical protein